MFEHCPEVRGPLLVGAGEVSVLTRDVFPDRDAISESLEIPDAPLDACGVGDAAGGGDEADQISRSQTGGLAGIHEWSPKLGIAKR
jgi:hypothetical protein